MELKPVSIMTFIEFSRLLIVPYGIETLFAKIYYCICVILLIVPYGIETYLQRAAILGQFHF